MSQQPAGWYDDPQVPGQLRYYDGVVWTDNTYRPGPPPGPASQQPASQQYSSQLYGHPGPGNQSYGDQQDGGRPWQQHGHPYDPSQSPFPVPRGQRTERWVTPDGAPLAGWWRRVGAYLIDALICSLIATPLAAPLTASVMPQFEDWFTEVVRAVRSGATVAPLVPAEVAWKLTLIGLISALVYFLYDTLFVGLSGRTPGRRVAGTAVRRVAAPGPIGLGPAMVRTLVKVAGRLVSGVAFLGFLGSLFTLLDVLWPLWDQRRQALHDKVVDTQTVVVRGAQPRRPGR